MVYYFYNIQVNIVSNIKFSNKKFILFICSFTIYNIYCINLLHKILLAIQLLLTLVSSINQRKSKYLLSQVCSTRVYPWVAPRCAPGHKPRRLPTRLVLWPPPSVAPLPPTGRWSSVCANDLPEESYSLSPLLYSW